MAHLIVALAQVNPLVGDIPGNARLVISAVQRARQQFKADIVVFPELVLTGYPPEDLLFRPSLQGRVERALNEVRAACQNITAVLGYPRRVGAKLYNMAGVISGGQLVAEYAKNMLPNYLVFDEKRYFEPGSDICVVDIRGVPIAITVCEDIWFPEPIARARARGARLMLNINASPFHCDKPAERRALIEQRAREGAMPVVYVNQVGGQDELVFDGGSMVSDAGGTIQFQAPMFTDDIYPVQLAVAHDGTVSVPTQAVVAPLPLLESVYGALVMGVRDYVLKNGFKGVLLGLSGGIDSALVLAIAVDALGAERVEAIMMPFHYTSELSKTDAQQEAATLGVRYQSIGIEAIYAAFVEALAAEFTGLAADKTEENIQARARGVLLMAISNKKGYLVLTTGNKSEMAVGYATLYGDMAGGLDVLKDVPKSLVFELARYRNTIAPVIPESVIVRPPSAELAPDQKDEDSLPPYDVLDRILQLYVEQDVSANDIVAQGFDREDVLRVVRLVDINEYKRRQAPVGLRITRRGFGRDRRYPITNGWRAGD